MNSDRWSRVEEIVETALRCDTAGRETFLGRVCGGDPELRREIESLLAAHTRVSHILGEAPRALPCATSAPAALLGTLVNGKYRLDALLGVGAMGVVYRATDPRGGTIALKLIRSELFADAHAARRFRREAEAVARVRHPNVVAVFDLGIAQGTGMYIAMECLEGHSLHVELSRRGSIEPPEALGLMRQICAGVGAAHIVDVVHRDLKPENVFLEGARPDLRVKVLDFGIATLADAAGEAGCVAAPSDVFVGTPTYAAPEQWLGAAVDSRSDVYALGCMFYEMLVGRPPFLARLPVELMRQHLARPPEPPSRHAPDVPPVVDDAIVRALAKDPAARFPTAAALGRAITAEA